MVYNEIANASYPLMKFFDYTRQMIKVNNHWYPVGWRLADGTQNPAGQPVSVRFRPPAPIESPTAYEDVLKALRNQGLFFFIYPVMCSVIFWHLGVWGGIFFYMDTPRWNSIPPPEVTEGLPAGVFPGSLALWGEWAGYWSIDNSGKRTPLAPSPAIRPARYFAFFASLRFESFYGLIARQSPLLRKVGS